MRSVGHVGNWFGSISQISLRNLVSAPSSQPSIDEVVLSEAPESVSVSLSTIQISQSKAQPADWPECMSERMSERLSKRMSTSGAPSCESSCQPHQTSCSPAMQQAAPNQASRRSSFRKKQLVHPGSSVRSSRRPSLIAGQVEEGIVAVQAKGQSGAATSASRAAWRRRNSSCIQEKLHISSRLSVSAPPSERGAYRCQHLRGTAPSSHGSRDPQQDPEPTPHTSATRTLERIRGLDHRLAIRPGSSASMPGGALDSAAELSATCAAIQTRRPSALADSLQWCRRKVSMSGSEKQRRGSDASDGGEDKPQCSLDRDLYSSDRDPHAGEDKLNCSATDLDDLHIA